MDKDAIKKINEWALKYPTHVFSEKFARQRNYLSDDTWNEVVRHNAIKSSSPEYNMIPSRLRSSIYNNELGQSRNEVGRNIIDGISEVASYAPIAGDVLDATKAGLDFKAGNNLAGTIGLAGLVLPNILEKPLKMGFKKGIKNVDNFVNGYRKQMKRAEDLSNAYSSSSRYHQDLIIDNNKIMDMLDNPLNLRESNLRTDQGKRTLNSIKRNEKEYITSLAQQKKSYLKNDPDTYVFPRDVGEFSKYELNRLFKEGKLDEYIPYKDTPSYALYAHQMKADPNSPRTAAGFISRQRKSVRGVTAPNEIDGRRMLTDVSPSKRTGGDMLNTGGGLYTSNSMDIADAFSNNQGDSNNPGYIGFLKSDFKYDPNKSVIENLETYRNRHSIIYNTGTGKSTTQNSMGDIVSSSYGGPGVAQRVYTNPEEKLEIYKLIKKNPEEAADKGMRWGFASQPSNNLYIKDEAPIGKYDRIKAMSSKYSLPADPGAPKELLTKRSSLMREYNNSNNIYKRGALADERIGNIKSKIRSAQNDREDLIKNASRFGTVSAGLITGAAGVYGGMKLLGENKQPGYQEYKKEREKKREQEQLKREEQSKNKVDKFQKGGNFSSEDLGNPLYNKKKPLTIKQQEDLVINTPRKLSAQLFKKSFNVARQVSNLHPVASIVNMGIDYVNDKDIKKDIIGESSTQYGNLNAYMFNRNNHSGKLLKHLFATPFKAFGSTLDLKDIYDEVKKPLSEY